MQIGWCAALAKAPLLEELGYDYIEVPLATFGLEDAASVQAAATALADCALPTPAFGYFLPRDMPIVGPRVDTARVRNYLAYAAELMALVGGKVIAFGSGWARTPPPDWPPASTEQQLIEFLRLRPMHLRAAVPSSPSSLRTARRRGPSTTWRTRCAWRARSTVPQ
jgi:hypothetical protein